MSDTTCVYCFEKAIVLKDGKPVCFDHATETDYRFGSDVLTVEKLMLVARVVDLIDPFPELSRAFCVMGSPAANMHLRDALKRRVFIHDSTYLKEIWVGVWCPFEEVYLPRNRKEAEMLETKDFYDMPPEDRPAIPMFSLSEFVRRAKEYNGDAEAWTD